MPRSTKVILLLLASLVLTHPYTATAAEKKDVNKVIRLIRQAATDKAKPSFFLSYMGFDYSTSVGLKNGRSEFVEIVAKTYYGTKDEFKTYTFKDNDLDGIVDSCVYKLGDVVKGTLDRNKEAGEDIRTDCQSLYDSAIYFSLLQLNKK